MKNLFYLMLFCLPVISAAQAPDTQKSTPSTKLEGFSAKTGIVVVKGFSEIGVVSGLGGRITVTAREFRDASNPKLTMYGVAFEVKESGRLERENISLIDEDEIDSLLKGLEYIYTITKGVTTLADFEAQYRTKGDFAITVFSNRDDTISAAVSSGRIGKTQVFVKLAELERLRSLINDAKKMIATAKAGK